MIRIPIVTYRGTAMGARLTLVTAGLVLVTAAVAGCSSTTGSPVAMQDDATPSASSSVSAGASPAASTGPAPSSPVATPTDSPPASGSPSGSALLGQASAPTNNDVCDAGLQYSCGGIGASGVGTVFYANSTAFACGANMASSCNYLEVAPNGWNGTLVNCPGSGTGLVQSSCGGSPNATSDWGHSGTGTGKGYAYCGGTGGDQVIPNASSAAIGSGYGNTSAMLSMCDSGDAGELARGYTGGGQSDWSLPSQDELNALYYYPDRNAIGGFASARYWSSSQEPDNTNYAWAQDFTSGDQSPGELKTDTFGVRPVRAF